MEQQATEPILRRDFKGVWIPKEIYLNQSLTWGEKLLLIEISSLDNEEGCFASNEYFAKMFGRTTQTISVSISRLKELKFIYEEKFTGRYRVLRSNIKTGISLNDIPKNQTEPKLPKAKRVKTETNFTPPTEADVVKFFMENDYPKELGERVYKYYKEGSWKDSNGKQVKNWKQKMRGVWFKPENKPVEKREEKNYEGNFTFYEGKEHK